MNIAAPSYGKIQTASGRMIEPFRPDPELITIEDIAHALSNQCRFSGHIQQLMTVAQHSVLVSEMVERTAFAGEFLELGTLGDLEEQRRQYALWGLLHDASEAYLIDLPRPIKHQPSMQPYRDAEDRMLKVIAKKFGLSDQMPDVVHVCDGQQLEIEARSLLIPSPTWVNPNGPRLDRVWSSSEARLKFLQRFYQLQSSSK